MMPDPTLHQRYADILEESANADLAVMVQALDAHFTATPLPQALSRAPRPAAHDGESVAPRTTMYAMKGSIPMEDHVITLEKRHNVEPERDPSENRPRRRSYPFIAAAVLVLIVAGFFGVQLLRQHQPGASTPGSGISGKTPTVSAAPPAYLRLDDKASPVLTHEATTPVTNLLIGSGDNQISIQVHLDDTQTKPGDVVTAVWEVAGIPLQPLSSGEECCRHQIVAHDPYAVGFNLYAALTNAGAGSVIVSYNGKATYKESFVITAYTTPLPVPPTPMLPSGPGTATPTPRPPTPSPTPTKK